MFVLHIKLSTTMVEQRKNVLVKWWLKSLKLDFQSLNHLKVTRILLDIVSSQIFKEKIPPFVNNLSLANFYD